MKSECMDLNLTEMILEFCCVYLCIILYTLIRFNLNTLIIFLLPLSLHISEARQYMNSVHVKYSLVWEAPSPVDFLSILFLVSLN